jgi:amiloride-sensitive sodium channel
MPSIIKADDDLKQVPASVRKCYFDDEKQLRFFKTYTQKNCEFECLSTVINRRCNCVPFYYIRSSSWDVCEYRRMKFCVEKFLYERSIGNVSKGDNCDCLPACNSISYTYEIIDTVFGADFPV